MPHRPYKKTVIDRVLLTQEIRVILAPEVDAPPGTFRQVQLVIPPSPRVYVALDRTPKSFGLNRVYKMAPVAANAPVIFTLLPEQFVVAAADENHAILGMIVQYMGGE